MSTVVKAVRGSASKAVVDPETMTGGGYIPLSLPTWRDVGMACGKTQPF